MRVYVRGIGLMGPGLSGWRESAAILAGLAPYHATEMPRPIPGILPATERRRSTQAIRLSAQVAQEALKQSQLPASDITTIFASSSGDSEVLHHLCVSLATQERFVSPTHFHHSVHNAAAGYWHIAVGSQASSTSLSSYDASFCGGLLEAAVQVCVERSPVMLVAYDTPAPRPLHDARPLTAPFGMAIILTGNRMEQTVAQLDIHLPGGLTGCATFMDNAELENLRNGNPAARGLPLLKALAITEATALRMDYLDNSQLHIDVLPCSF